MGDLSAALGLPHLQLPFTHHCSKPVVNIDDLFAFMKANHQVTDRKDIPRKANIRLEIAKYTGGVIDEEKNVFLTINNVLRYQFNHCDDFSVCAKIVDEVCRSLQGHTCASGVQASDGRTILSLYNEIGNCKDIDIDHGVTSIVKEEVPYLQDNFRDQFHSDQWERIKLFEFQFANLEKEKRKKIHTQQYLSSVPAKKWSFWETTKKCLQVGKHLNKINQNVCGYQTKRMEAAAVREGIKLSVHNTYHLPGVLEDQVSKELLLYNLDYDSVVVDCVEICKHPQGIHIFLANDSNQTEDELSNAATIARSALKDHVAVPEIVFITRESLSKYQQKESEPARFSLRDSFFTKKLKNDVVHIDRADNEGDDMNEQQASTYCEVCFMDYSDWLSRPLSVSLFNHLTEWRLYVPLPVQILFEKAFVNAESIDRSGNSERLLASKVGRLTTIYDICLNTINRLYVGMTQEMNTAELIVNYHSIANVFNITQSSGITKSLMAAERKLKLMASPERCYYKTYLAAHPMTYETTHDPQPLMYNVRLRDCHLIFMVDNLVRLRRKADPDPGEGRTSQVCTLPETVKGLPRDAKITASWHNKDCDLAANCICKQASAMQNYRLLTEHNETEADLSRRFRGEAVWGIKFTLNSPVVQKLMEQASQNHNPIEDLDETDELLLSMENVSLDDDQHLHDIEDLEASLSKLDVLEHSESSAIGQYENIGMLSSIHQPEKEASTPLLQDSFDEESTTSETSTDSASIFSLEQFTEDDEEIVSVEEDNQPQKERLWSSTSEFAEPESSFSKFQVPPLLCRHPPPAVGRDDDKRKLREILDDVLVKSGQSLHENSMDRILIAPDHKIAINVFQLLAESKYRTFLPEFPVLHLIKSKITNLMTAYKDAGLFHLLKFMKDEEDESDWTKLVSLSEIETAARNIKRLSLALHLAAFLRFIESLHPIEADNLLIDLVEQPLATVEERWQQQYSEFVAQGSRNNATFCLHTEMMEHCDEIVGIQLAERLGGPQGYALLLAIVKSSLPFAFLNGASSYASFCVQLLHQHYTAGHFYQHMKETLFSTPYKDMDTNFALDAQREMDHRDAIKGFRPSSDVSAVIPRLAVVDDLQIIHDARKGMFQVFEDTLNADSSLQSEATSQQRAKTQHAGESIQRRGGNTDSTTETSQQEAEGTCQSNTLHQEAQMKKNFKFLGKDVSEKDIKFAARCAEMILRRGAFSTSKNAHPLNIYDKKIPVLPDTTLDRNTIDLGKFMITRYICQSALAGTSEGDCPEIDSINGSPELKKKIKSSKSITIKRNTCKATTQKTEQELIEEKRQKDLKQITKLSLHATSAMNSCQALVNADCSKVTTQKAKGMKDALLFALCRENPEEKMVQKQDALREHRISSVEREGLIFFQCKQIPPEIKLGVKVATVECAGVKFKASMKSGRQYLEFVESTVLQSILKAFPFTHRVVLCEEKYSFTPDTLKALTRAKRQQKDKADVFHLKNQEEMVSMAKFSKTAVTRTAEGKKLVSNFLGANVHEFQIHHDLVMDVDSEFILSPCSCETIEEHQQKPCYMYSTPLRAIFTSDIGFVTTEKIQHIKQRKGEAELAQADWLTNIAPELEADDAVLAYVTSGDIDAVPIHMLAAALFWPRWPNGSFQHDIYVLLKKPTKDPDIYCITKIVEKLESMDKEKDIALITAITLCIGGNDFIPKFLGISHEDWMRTIFSDMDILSSLFVVERNTEDMIKEVHLNQDIFITLVKKLYCPKSLNYHLLSYEEVRQLSIKPPGDEKKWKSHQSWMPPQTAVKKVLRLVESNIQYMLTVCKPDADLPDFLGNGGIRQTADGEIVYDLGPDVHYTDRLQLLGIPEEELMNKMKAAKMKRKSKRTNPITPEKDPAFVKRKPTYESTPRKIREMRQKHCDGME